MEIVTHVFIGDITPKNINIAKGAFYWTLTFGEPLDSKLLIHIREEQAKATLNELARKCLMAVQEIEEAEHPEPTGALPF